MRGRLSLLRGYGRVTGRQARSKALIRSAVGQPRTGHALVRVAARYARTAAAFHFPTISFSFQNVFHLHPIVRGAVFGTERYHSVGFIFAKRYGPNTHVHRDQVRTLGQVVDDRLPDGLGALDVFAAAEKQEKCTE